MGALAIDGCKSGEFVIVPWFVGLCWIITALGACLGAVALVVTFTESKGAPQEAAGAAIAVALCVIPYVFTRSCQAFSEMRRQGDLLAAVNALREDLRAERMSK